MKNIAEIIEKGVREHPELGIGSNTEGIDVRSVGNTAALRQTALIEAFNLKAALECAPTPPQPCRLLLNACAAAAECVCCCC